MTPTHDAGPRRRLTVPRISIVDFEISWAGETPWDQRFCFGSEDGRVVFSNALGLVSNARQLRAVESGEAINGIAFSHGFMAVSTRSEVVVLEVPGPEGEGAASVVTRYDGGSHGVCVAPSGSVVAPLGVGGLALFEVQAGPPVHIGIIKSSHKTNYFYKTIGLRSTDGRDVLTSAARRDGLVNMLRTEMSIDQTSIPSAGLDIIDVCSLGSKAFPLAAAALTTDGSLVLMNDVLNDEPRLLKFDGVPGTAFNVFGARGHVFILTSESLYSFIGLASRFLEGKTLIGPESLACVDLQAVDASLAFDRWLLIVMPDGSVAMLEIDAPTGVLDQSPPTSQASENTFVFPTYDIPYAFA